MGLSAGCRDPSQQSLDVSWHWRCWKSYQQLFILVGAAAAPALRVVCVPTSSFKFVSSGLELGPFPSVPVRIGLGLPGCWIPVCPKGMFCLHSKKKKKKEKGFSHFLGQCVFLSSSGGWEAAVWQWDGVREQHLLVFPQKLGLDSLPRRLVAGNGVCPRAGSCPCPCFRILLLRARGKRFSCERAKDRCLLSLLQVHVLRPGFAMCWKPFPKLFPTFPCALGTAQSPGLSAYDLEMEGISSRRGMQGQELFAGMLCTQVQCILGRLRSGLGVSSVE